MSYRWNNNDSDRKAHNSGSSIITCTSDHSSSRRAGSINKTSSNEQTAAAVRSRWSPKPEQILILESFFNSGMVNPPKDETVRIRMLLENYGPVGDANVFYWFQNRRSRSRRLQRQIQANMIKASNNADQMTLHYDNPSPFLSAPSTYTCSGGGLSSVAAVDGFLGADQILFDQDIYGNGALATADAYDASNSYFPHKQHGGVAVDDQGGFMTVFINGVPTEVPVGPVDMREIMCGQDVVLIHSSGHPVPVNEYGFSTYSLQHGESYFLVDKSM